MPSEPLPLVQTGSDSFTSLVGKPCSDGEEIIFDMLPAFQTIMTGTQIPQRVLRGRPAASIQETVILNSVTGLKRKSSKNENQGIVLYINVTSKIKLFIYCYFQMRR